MSYYEKYIKYKNKYIILKNNIQIGGNNDIPLYNIMDRKNIQYHEYVINKYKYSKKHYNKKYTDENIYEFLNDFDNMNVYPLYPELISCKLTPDNHKLDDNISLTKNFSNDKFNKQIKKLDSVKNSINEKLEKRKKSDKKKRGEIGIKMRRLFSYEVSDYVENKFSIYPISNAWLKMHELIVYYNLIDKETSKPLKSFHICELPGSFIMSINHYIKSHTNREFDWHAQSLNQDKISNRRTIIGDQYGLAKKYSDRYDFGRSTKDDVGTGDMLRLFNVVYYIKKYKNMDIVTSDCGIKFEGSEFVKQEEMSERLFWYQFVCALGMLKKGGNYVAKLFTFFRKKMVESLYISSLLFDEVYISKPLMTRPTSNELYLVCKGFRGGVNIDKFIEYLQNFDERESLLDLDIIPNDFFDNLNFYAEIFGYRMIANTNMIIFGQRNSEYIQKNKKIYDHILETTLYYAKYFSEYNKIKKINKNDKLLDLERKRKWKTDFTKKIT